MNKVIEIFKEIQSTSGLNDKKKIITDNKDNELFKKCLKFLLDGNVVTGISDKKLSKGVNLAEGLREFSLETIANLTFEDIIEYLLTHNSGKDSDIAFVKIFIKHQPEQYQEFYFQMITKKFRLGADAKLVNKCIPGLIPTFDLMLGTSIEKIKLKGDEKIFISQKLNGTRCAFVGDKCMTRQGKEYIGLQHIIEDLQELVGTNMFVDGELVYKNKEGLTDSEAFQKGTGIAMSKDEDKSDLKLIVFDMFPLDEFWNGQSKETYSERLLNYLLPLRTKVTSNHFENVSVVPMFYNGYDHAEIWNWLDYAENNDMEGVIVNLDTPYECKRSKNLIKVKKFYTYDLEVVDVEEGDGRNKGTLGALVVKYKNNTVNVGSGFTDEERKNFWESREDIIGRVIEVKYKEITTDKKTGLESLQFPVFCGIREFDKEVSYD